MTITRERAPAFGLPFGMRAAEPRAGRPILADVLRMPSGEVPWLPGLRLPVGRLPGADAGVLGRIGELEVRLARTVGEVVRAQQLRYRVFYEEMSAIADAMTLLTRRDADAYDAVADHMLVVDRERDRPGLGGARPAIVGTYRLIGQDAASRAGGFYSAGEFDLSPLLDRHPRARFLELGRSCIARPYRVKRSMELLWAGVWAYVQRTGQDVLIGCASLEGTDPERLALPLSFLHHHALAAPEWRVAALPHRRVEMNRMAPEAIDPKRALAALPPLLKAYLRLGAKVGDGAVIDRQFGTTDVFIVLPVAAISARHVAYYGAEAGRHAA